MVLTESPSSSTDLATSNNHQVATGGTSAPTALFDSTGISGELLLAHVQAAPRHPPIRGHRPRRLATVRDLALAVLAFPWDRPNLEPAALVHCLTPCRALSPRQAAFRVRRPGSHLRQEHQRLQHQRLRVAAEGYARPRNHANANENTRSNHSGDRRRRRVCGYA